MIKTPLSIRLISLYYLYDFNLGQLEEKTYKLYTCTWVWRKRKALRDRFFSSSICFTLSYIMSYLKKSPAVFCFFDLIRIFSTYLVTLKMLFTIILLLLLYYYLYKQNISHWSSCFYWPFGLLKTLTKTEKKKKKTPLYKWLSILGI